MMVNQLSIVRFLMLPLVLLMSCKGDGQRTSTQLKESEIISLINNSTFEIVENDEVSKSYSLSSGDKVVVVFEKKGNTYHDANDYEMKFKETLILEFDRNFEKAKYADKDLKKLNCTYIWIGYGKELIKEVRRIKKGEVSVSMKNDCSYQVSVNVDTEFGYGTLLQQRSTRKITFKKGLNLSKSL
jgi:hypothetical protein